MGIFLQHQELRVRYIQRLRDTT